MRSAVANGNGMIARGNVAAPVIWEHDLAADPIPLAVLLSGLRDPRTWAEGFARGTFGYASGYSVETVRGEPVALAVLNVPDDADLKQFEKTRYVSARVNFDHIDTNGRRWPGASIGHIAATPQPVQMGQAPVGWPWGVMLSAAIGRRSRCSVFLSEKFREGVMPDDNGGKKGGDGDGSSVGNGGGANGKIGELLSEFANMNPPIVFPEGTVTNVGDLVNALKIVNANRTTPATADNDNDLDNLGGGGAQPAGGGGMPAMLSSTPAGKALLDEKRRSFVARLKAVEAKAVTKGHATVPAIRQMEKAFLGFDEPKLLSVIQHGGAASRAVRELEILERLCAEKPLVHLDDDSPGTVNLSGMRPVPAPTTPGAPDPEAQAAEIEKARQDAKDRVAARRQLGRPAETAEPAKK